MGNSDVLRDIKGTFFNGDPVYFRQRLEQFVSQFNLGSEDIKNLSIAALIGKMMGLTDEESVRNELQRFLDMARAAGWSDRPAAALKPK